MIGDTIVAPATPPGHGGVSLIRISGPHSKSIAKKITGLNSLENRRSTFSAIQDRAVKIDDVLVSFFKNPFSYTGEDVVELSCHGNPVIVDQILNLLYKKGARLADPGEFTKRAFLNGKLDLIQAESVSCLIGARSTRAAELNQKILSGALSTKLQTIKGRLLDVLAELEFEFDVSEEDLLMPGLVSRSIRTLKINRLNCAALVDSFKEGSMYNNGSRVVIYGSPNVGKSTLLNALLEKDRAITSHIPGTTRDAVDAQIMLDGIPVTLVDTAGVRETNSSIEAAGISRSLQEAEMADLLLHVVDVDSDFNNNEYPIVNIGDKHHFTIRNKCDLEKPEKELKGVFFVSALRGDGIDNLKKAIKNKLIDLNCTGSDVVLTTRRQVSAINSCEQNLKQAVCQLKNKQPELELVSFEIREAVKNLDGLFGKTSVDEILNRIFSGFCVGK